MCGYLEPNLEDERENFRTFEPRAGRPYSGRRVHPRRPAKLREHLAVDYVNANPVVISRPLAPILASGKMVVISAKIEGHLRLASRKYTRIVPKLGFDAKLQSLKPETPPVVIYTAFNTIYTVLRESRKPYLRRFH
ncbi:hypothetical protein FRC12_019017 [Ceratobasidium sp. 428]|nr:hypothetical protein FRC12_019017 [Ceratobasidium sp. 428]